MPEWVVQLIVYVGMAGAIYGGIRADLKNLHERVAEAKEAAVRAHTRIDSLLERGRS